MGGGGGAGGPHFGSNSAGPGVMNSGNGMGSNPGSGLGTKQQMLHYLVTQLKYPVSATAFRVPFLHWSTTLSTVLSQRPAGFLR